jgi:hypothetical protein
LASSLYMRDLRVRVPGELWRFAEYPGHPFPSGFTLIPSKLVQSGNSLNKADPKLLCRTLRSDLNRYGAVGASGYLIAFLDAEYEIGSDTFRLHFHGLAAGEMLGVLDRLRRAAKYRSSRSKEYPLRNVQRVRVNHQLTSLPSPITYLLKPFWSARWEGQVNGRSVRGRRAGRIPEPRHSQALLWLDRWRLQDITLMIGVSVRRNGLQLSSPRTYTNGRAR